MAMKRETNAQTIMKSKKSTARLRQEYERASRIARQRMQKLKEAKMTNTEFYREHRRDFGDLDVIGRNNIAKELAKVNRFLNSKSSTPKGLKEAEQNLIRAVNESMSGISPDYEDEESYSAKYQEYINEGNVRQFQKFMSDYRSRYQEQTQLPSDLVVQAFIDSERLKLSKKDLLQNLELYVENMEQLEEASVEDLFAEGEKIDKRRRFKVEDYLFSR